MSAEDVLSPISYSGRYFPSQFFVSSYCRQATNADANSSLPLKNILESNHLLVPPFHFRAQIPPGDAYELCYFAANLTNFGMIPLNLEGGNECVTAKDIESKKCIYDNGKGV